MSITDSVPGPFGPIPADNPVAQYAVYAFQNGTFSIPPPAHPSSLDFTDNPPFPDSEWLEGLGLAMSVSSANASFYLGYDVRRFAHNLIALSQDTSQTISDWYNSSSSWRPSGDSSYTTSLKGRPDLSVTCITDALDGNDRTYNYDVHIGLQQSVEKSKN